MLTIFNLKVMNSIRILIFALCLLAVYGVRIEDNGYKGITISFSEKAQLENSYFNFEKMKHVLSNASEILFRATRKRSYFEEFVFVIPSKWANDSLCDGDVNEVPRKIDIYVTDSNYIPTLTAQHSKGCGQEGDIIYLPINWLTGEVEDLAYQFVQQWSTYRYGVFSENPEKPGSCIATSDYSWSPAGCYNIDLETEATFDENGLPVCYFPDDFKNEDLRSSIMFSSNSSKPLHFCDGSDLFPHNPVAPTLHNRICEGSVWSVIKNTEDFRYSRNLPGKDAKQPTFRCFKDSKIHMTLAVQDTDTKLRTEIRYAFFYFLSNLAVGDMDVSLVTFSNDSLTDAMEPIDLDLKDGAKLKSHLLTELTLNKEIPNICLLCGLRKAYEVSSVNENPLRVIVLFANASSLRDTDTSKLIELIQRNDGSSILHLIFLEDAEDTIPSSLVDTMQNGRGRIFRIKNDRVFVFTQMSIALLDASKNTLHREDKILVVHQETRVNVVSGFRDVFMTPKHMKGNLYYSMQCKERGEISSDDSGCSVLDQQLQSPICESKVDLKDEDSSKTWTYSFEYIAGKEGTTCVSLALLKLESSSVNVFTINGWLNYDKITPGYNALIIYAEVIGSEDKKAHVEALISGPGLTDFRLELRDNGNGDPDVIKGDHIYSRYFTSFSQKGTYTVSIYAASSIAKGNSKSDNTVAQTKVIGSFRVTNAPPKEDIIPPNRVSDLNVISIDNENKTALLQWTAPGNNYDDGRATEYKLYISDDWRNLQEALMNKILPNILNTSEMIPKLSGNKEKEIFNLPNNSLPIMYYIALKASDKTGNEGRLSNIIQLPLIVTDLITGNLTKNDTINDKGIVTSSLEENVIPHKYVYAIAGSALCLIVLIIVINILIWILCFRKYKRNCSAAVLNETCHFSTKVQVSGDNINSDENILRSEYETTRILTGRKNENLPPNQNAANDNDTSNPMMIYAKVKQQSKNSESPIFSSQNAEISKQQKIQISTHRENDLGFV